jgi:hypothetical protein
MIDPVTDLTYRTADDRALGTAELEELLTTEETALELYRGTDAILSVAEPRRFEARGVDAMVRHPSADPADAFIEVSFRATLSLPRDRCQPVGATPPARPVSTARAEAASNAAAEDGSEDGSDTPQTWESSGVTTRVSSGAEEVTSPDADPHGSGDEAATSGESQSQSEASDSDDHDERAESDDDNDGKITFSLQDGPADDDAAE